MFNNNASFKYKIVYKIPFEITCCYINGIFTLQYGVTKSRYNIRHIKPYTYDTNVEDSIAENDV